LRKNEEKLLFSTWISTRESRQSQSDLDESEPSLSSVVASHVQLHPQGKFLLEQSITKYSTIHASFGIDPEKSFPSKRIKAAIKLERLPISVGMVPVRPYKRSRGSNFKSGSGDELSLVKENC
jgi:hypothetical protein